MTDYKQRVVAEKAELDDKIAKLKAFFTSPVFDTLSEEECDILEEQHDVMQVYSNILSTRITFFKE